MEKDISNKVDMIERGDNNAISFKQILEQKWWKPLYDNDYKRQSIQRKEIKSVHMYAPNIRHAKHIKQMLKRHKGRNGNNTIVGDFKIYSCIKEQIICSLYLI